MTVSTYTAALALREPRSSQFKPGLEARFQSLSAHMHMHTGYNALTMLTINQIYMYMSVTVDYRAPVDHCTCCRPSLLL